MLLELLQHVFVTLVAVAAGWIIVRRVFATVRPGPASHTCASCPVAQGGKTASQPAGTEAPPPTTRPLILMKRSGD